MTAPGRVGAPRIANEKRWAEKTRRLDNGCLLYTAGKDRDGYGRFWDTDERRSVSAHHYAWKHERGTYPEQLDHLCHTTECTAGDCPHRACVEVTHLAEATTRENTLRGNAVTAINARKLVCVRGHSLDDARVRKDGSRECRPCRRELDARRR